MNDKTENPAEIYLVPVGLNEYVWCDTPAPGEGMREEDATRYVRADLVPVSNEVLARRVVELTEKLSHHDYVIAQSENATGILCGNDMPGNSPLVLMARKAMRENAELKAQVEELQEKIFDLQCFDVDLMRCLKTIAFEHNHADIKRYQQLAKECMDRISVGNKVNEIKAQAVTEFGEDVIAHFEGCNYNLTRQTLEWYINEKLRQAAKGE